MDKDYLGIIESLFTDIRDHSDNPDLVTGLLSQLKTAINEFFANIKKYTDDWLVSDNITNTINRIYDALSNPKYNDATVYVSYCLDALNKYKEYIGGLEEYIKTVFGIQEDDGVAIDNIREKNCFVFNKNGEYINGLFNADESYHGNQVSMANAVNQFEVIIDYINHLDIFKNECLSLIEVISQEYASKGNSELTLLKISSASIYIYSILFFNQRLDREVMYIVDELDNSIRCADRPPEEPIKYQMF